MTNPNLGNTRARTRVLANPNAPAPAPLPVSMVAVDALKTSMALPPALPAPTRAAKTEGDTTKVAVPQQVSDPEMLKRLTELETNVALLTKRVRSLAAWGPLKGTLIVISLLTAMTWIFWLPMLRDAMGVGSPKPHNGPPPDLKTVTEEVFTLRVGEIKKWPFEFAPPPGSYKVRGMIGEKEVFSLAKRGDIWQGVCTEAFAQTDVKLRYSGGNTSDVTLRMQSKKEGP